MAEAVQPAKRNHMITVDNRKSAVITGINEVTSYDSNAIVANCDAGEIILQGKLLHISTFDQSTGKLVVDGTINSLQYVESKQKSDSFLSRLLK